MSHNPFEQELVPIIGEQDSPVQTNHDFSDISLSRNTSVAGPSTDHGTPPPYDASAPLLSRANETLDRVKELFKTFDTDNSGLQFHLKIP